MADAMCILACDALVRFVLEDLHLALIHCMEGYLQSTDEAMFRFGMRREYLARFTFCD